METQFVPYDLALKLKELGFDELCFGWWSYINGNTASFYSYNCNNTDLVHLNTFPKNCTAPLWQQAFDWLFKEFSYICTITNNMTYEQKENILNEAIRDIQNNLSK